MAFDATNIKKQVNALVILNSSANTVCLAIWIEQETDLLTKCLNSVAPFIDTWVIYYSGHDHSIKNQTAAALEGLPGQLEHVPSNSDAIRDLLAAAGKRADWVLWLNPNEDFESFSFGLQKPDDNLFGLVDIVKEGHTVREVRLFPASALTKNDLPLAVPRTEPVVALSSWQLRHQAGRESQQNDDHIADKISQLEKAIGSNETTAELLNQLGTLHLRINQITPARDYFQRVNKFNVENTKSGNSSWFANYMLGNIYLRLQDRSLAEDAFKHCLTLDSSRIEPAYRLAVLAYEDGDYGKAQLYCDSLIGLTAPTQASYFEPDVYHHKCLLLLTEITFANKDIDAFSEHLKQLESIKVHHKTDTKRIQELRSALNSILEQEKTNSERNNQQQELTCAPDTKLITVGMATHEDFHGTYFSIMSIVLYHREVLDQIEILVIDNNPGSADGKAVESLCGRVAQARYVAAGEYKGTAVRERIFAEASGAYVICMDCHVFLHAGSLARLIEYFTNHPESGDLLHGPLYYDNHRDFSTHMDPIWRAGFYGVWGTDSRCASIDAEPFEIPLQGMGLFACRREAWLGFNAKFRGFGGEEGYIHEKFRQHGHRVLCLPFLRWTHRFDRPGGPKYENRWEHRIRNYLIGWHELGLDAAPLLGHFKDLLGAATVARVNKSFTAEVKSPFWKHNLIYCVAKTEQSWQSAFKLFEQCAIEQVVQRVDDHKQLPKLLREASKPGNTDIIVFDAEKISAVTAKALKTWIRTFDSGSKDWAAIDTRFGQNLPGIDTSGVVLKSELVDRFARYWEDQISRVKASHSDKQKNQLVSSQVHYMIAYWLEPGSPPEREQALRTYFDLQRHTKQQFGAEQLIITNIDYPGAIKLIEPEGFERKHAIHTKYFGLQQLMEMGYDLPICMHDHDMFIKEALQVDSSAIYCCSKYEERFSDQLVVFPPAAKIALENFINKLKTWDLDLSLHRGWGSEIRHEGMLSSEMTLANMKPYPFDDFVINDSISSRDLVSFNIKEGHSLDGGEVESDRIPDFVKAVHGHLNKGQATDVLVDWLVN